MSNLFEKSIKFNLNNSVEYSAGGIISKQIVKNDTGNITLFSFDQGQALSEHTAPFDAMIHVIEGQAIVTINGTEQSLNAGEAVIMPANIPHAIRAEKQFKMILSMIKG